MENHPIDSVSFHPIGIIHSPFQEPAGMPIQPPGARGVQGWIEVFPDYVPGLADLDGFSHIILLYYFHKAGEPLLTVTPFLDSTPRGVFATRAPRRPNRIGLSVVRLRSVEGSTLHVEDLDILDGTPLLDIKPYVPDFDHNKAERIGWLKGSGGRVDEMRADDRFDT